MADETQYAEDDADNRTLSYFQALVEQREIPIFESNERNTTNANVYMIQAMGNTDLRNIVLLSTPPPIKSAEESKQMVQQPGEGYSLIRLLD